MARGPARVIAGLLVIVAATLAIALAGCGGTTPAPSTPPAVAASATRAAASTTDPANAAAAGRHTRSSSSGASAMERRLARAVAVAKGTYSNEIEGGVLLQQLARIARDGTLLASLSRGDTEGALREADFQLNRPLNHLAHVTRIAVVRASKEVVNATINANGVFVVAPGKRVLRSGGRVLGTLWVSIQDVIGFAKLVHNLTGAVVVVRGSSGQVRTSPGAGFAASVRLPPSGYIAIAGRRYLLRSFREIGWGAEPLTVWVLER